MLIVTEFEVTGQDTGRNKGVRTTDSPLAYVLARGRGIRLPVRERSFKCRVCHILIVEPREGGIVRLRQAQSCSVSSSKIVTSIVVDLIVSENAVPCQSDNESPQQKSGVQGIHLPACK